MRADIVSEALQKYRGSIEQNSVESFIQALRAAPDSCAEPFMKMRAKSKLLTFVLSLFFGVFALDRFYIGERKSAISKIVLIFVSAALCITPFIVYNSKEEMGVWGLMLFVGFIAAIVAAVIYLADVFTLSKKVKDINYRYLAGFLHDATGEAKLAAAAEAAAERKAKAAAAEAAAAQKVSEPVEALAEEPTQIAAEETATVEEAAAEETAAETAAEETVPESVAVESAEELVAESVPESSENA